MKLQSETFGSPKTIEQAVEEFLAQAKAAGEMDSEVHPVSWRRKGAKLRVNLSDDTFLILHLAESTLH